MVPDPELVPVLIASVGGTSHIFRFRSRVRSHWSDSVLLFSLRFQIPYWTEIDCFSWWFLNGSRRFRSHFRLLQLPSFVVVEFRWRIVPRSNYRNVPSCWFLAGVFSCLLLPASLVRLFCCGLPFQIVGTDTNYFSWWSDSGIRNPLLLVSILLQGDWFRSEVRAGSS